jgi:Rrf2 family iron-sulfur cluster assembly transcriptional regulator
MRITAVEEYGLRCLLALARKGPDGQLSISEIAELEGLSVPYASKLLAILRRAGLVLAARGRGGGFTIARNAEQVTLYEVLTLLGGPLIDPNHCQKHTGQLEQCVHIENCSVHDILGGLAGYVQEFLSRTTLADLVRQQTKQPALAVAGEVTLAPTALKEELEKINNRIPLE